MLKFYFSLQLRRLKRKLTDLGGYPFLNIMVIISFFCGISGLLFLEEEYLRYGYLVFALQIVSLWSGPQHNDFLKLTYSKRDYYSIRLIENMVTALPFALLLCIAADVIKAIITLVLSALLVLFSLKVRWQKAIPTPFYKYPFEFTTGFRITFPFILAAYFFTYISMIYSNIGIGIFALIFISIICTFFYTAVEDFFYVWIFSAKAGRFLLDKLKIAVLSTLFLCLPILAALIAGNPDKVATILAFQALGLCYVCAGVVCKYSTYPGDIRVWEGMLLFVSCLCPPLLLFTIPFLYSRSIRSLEGILG